ncbi:MAG: LytTR family DNA-binding domain-containing protein [Faecalibacterium sp.]|jgi:DNA-binding LytR/AlgR family response regulator|nr:LytTR family DNA-binding domain-containing protein [Faecalibacterium sp.]
MIKVGFCDDELPMLDEISVLLDNYRVAKNQEIQYTAFQSPLDLLTGIERGLRFDILFLDVVMPGENGIEAAKEIREYDTDVKIIFLTSSAEFAVQSYAVGAYFYQMKPIWEESFFRLMDTALSECAKAKTDSLILRCKTGITRVPLTQLEYCEVIGRTLILHLTSGKVVECSGSLDDLGAQLAQFPNFLRPHRSYLVNMEYIQNITYREIAMACLAQVPIPHGKYTEIKNEFLEYAFRGKQVLL